MQSLECILSCYKFITNEWVTAVPLPDHKPLIILCTFNSELLSMTYSFFTQTLRNSFFFNFLQREEDNINERFNVSYQGSVGGLFLVGACDHFHFTNYHVCNPLTRTSLQLPTMLLIQKITVIGMCKNDIPTLQILVIFQNLTIMKMNQTRL